MKRLFSVLAIASALPGGVMLSQTQDVTVYELHPAPGQFVNTLPEAEEGDAHEEICLRATESLRNGELVHLGTLGGYITLGFDHPVENTRGSDFRILGNGFYAAADPVYGSETIGGSFEPGIVYVGVGSDPASAQWYELAGYVYNSGEIHDYTITYFKPEAEQGAHSIPFSTYDDYIHWEATWTENGEPRQESGYHFKNSFHRQTYWPLWETTDRLTFRAPRLPDVGIEQSGKGTYWVLYRYASDAYGYVDASLNDDDYSTFDIDWAVDGKGNPVHLDRIDFIRVATGVLQECGWLGEVSTEVAGAIDLHLEPGYDEDPIVIGPPATVAENPLGFRREEGGAVYDLTGRRVTNPTAGIYIRNGKKFIVR